MICPKCNYEIDIDAAYCPNCGYKIASDIICCPFCEREINDDTTYCPHCGKKLSDVDESVGGNSSKNTNKDKLNIKSKIAKCAAWLFGIMAILLVIVPFIPFNNDNQIDIEDLINGTDKEVGLFDNYNCETPLLSTYLNEYERRSYYRSFSAEEAERIVDKICKQMWYIEGTDSIFNINDTTIDGKRYSVIAAFANEYDGPVKAMYEIYFVYNDEPSTVYCIYYPNYLGETSTYLFFLDIGPLDDDSLQWISLNNESDSQKKEHEIELRTPQYSDEEIIQMASNEFESRMKSQYGGGVETLYHSATVKSSSVDFDKYTNTYTCTLNAVYSTNILDFWGTSNTSYIVNAVYRDTDYDIILEEFVIN